MSTTNLSEAEKKQKKKEYDQKYYLDNKAKKQQQMKEYYQDNQEVIKKQSKTWDEDNPDVITLGFTSSSFADITGVWCGKAVEKQEYCKGDEAGFLNVKQVGVGLSGEYCEAYQHDCLQIKRRI
jgi:hypothetical protein